MELHIPRTLEQTAFDRMSHKFEEAEDVSILLPLNLSVDELKKLASFLLIQKSGDLRNLLLADLVEYSEFPVELLGEVFNKGDVGCRVAISLKSNLPRNVEELCANSTEVDVREHYQDSRGNS